METISSPTLSIAQSHVADHEVIRRRSANYHPSIWGDRFIAYSSYAMETDVKLEHQFEHLKKRVRDKIVASADKPKQKLSLIDAIERLGVAYHFEYEIGMTLNVIEHSYNEVANNDDLYTVPLLFRLLRQHGYPVSCDVFNRFKDKEEKFQQSISGNVRGMLSLYEATQLRVHGEEILDEALDFTITHLNSALQKLSNNPMVEQVVHALNQPIHKGLTRLEARWYIPFYEQEDSFDKTLLDFAKLDFNRLQKLHQKELSEITRWWKDLDFASKLPFARDRVVECYFWIMGVCFEPQYYVARKVLTKVIALATIMDDIYDLYGTLEELVLLTDAIERWEIGALDQLPDYMKLFYQALLDVYNMIDYEMDKEGKSYATDYAKSAMKSLARAYFTEAKWFHGGYAPSFEEYMSNALVSGGYKMMATTSFIGAGELATKEALDWVSSDPLIVRAASVICRLMDDIVSHKDEQQRGDVPSAVECYIKQYGGTEDDALVELQKRIADAWKDMNAECLRPTAVPMPLLLRVLNLTRVIYVLYRDEDCYTNSGTRLKGFITSVLVDPVSIK